MKTVLSLMLCLLFFHVQGQQANPTSKLDLKLGAGVALSGSGDMLMTLIDNSLDWRATPYFTPSVSLLYGKSDRGLNLTSSLLQGNLNLFFSPFRNTRRNNFRIGTGLSVMGISNVYESGRTYIDGQFAYSEYAIEKDRTFGLNVLIEHEILLGDRCLLGLQAYTKMYQSGDILTGAMVKMGVRL